MDLVSETVQLRHSGKNYTGFCPFHANTRTPSFVVFPETGTWRCFGQCNEGGDIFRFVMKKEGWDFPEALRALAERAGVQLRPQTPQAQETAEEHDRLRQLLEEAVLFFRHQLLNTPPGQEAQAYLLKRGISLETQEVFGLGYAPQSWDSLLNHFKSKRYSEKDLIETGLVSEREPGDPKRGVYDRFRHRFMIPIRDERGRMAGFGARILNPDDVPKFLNSPQTPIFDKGHLLYGLDRARRQIRALDQVVIVEGYLDVIALHQAGFSNAVSPMGTALTETQLGLIKRFSRRIVLALDPDAAGAKATLRGLQLARQTLDRENEVAFDARGLLGHEARLQADIRVTTLPEGMDPDDVVLRDPAEWERILAQAKPVVVHVMETLAAGQDLDDPKVKADLARQVLPLIEDVPDAVEREAYRQRLARLLRIDEVAMARMHGAAGKGAGRRSTGSASRGQPQTGGKSVAEKSGSGTPRMFETPAFRMEVFCLGVLMRRPDLVYRIDRVLQQYDLPRLSELDFQYSEHQAIFELVLESLAQDVSEPLAFVLNGLGDSMMMDKADDLLQRTADVDPARIADIDRLLGELVRRVLNLRENYAREASQNIQWMMQDAQEEGKTIPDEYLNGIKYYTNLYLRFHKALNQYTH
ncbi:MAG: DNA primase [Anaerolineales bacterium]|nr:DNA primase [Anaerolineales bacterium]